MLQHYFYLVGDDIATTQALDVDSSWKFEDLQRATGLLFHVAQPLGLFHAPAQLEIGSAKRNQGSPSTAHPPQRCPQWTTSSRKRHRQHPPLAFE